MPLSRRATAQQRRYATAAETKGGASTPHPSLLSTLSGGWQRRFVITDLLSGQSGKLFLGSSINEDNRAEQDSESNLERQDTSQICFFRIVDFLPCGLVRRVSIIRDSSPLALGINHTWKPDHDERRQAHDQEECPLFHDVRRPLNERDKRPPPQPQLERERHARVSSR